MSGNDERPKKRPVYGIGEEFFEVYRDARLVEEQARIAGLQQQEERRSPRFRDKITQAVAGLMGIFVGNCLVVLLTILFGNIIQISVVIPICTIQAIFWFALLLDELDI